MNFTEALEILDAISNPQEIIALKLPADMQERVEWLLENNKTCGLTYQEEAEWQQYEQVEHIVRLAKAKALIQLKNV